MSDFRDRYKFEEMIKLIINQAFDKNVFTRWNDISVAVVNLEADLAVNLEKPIDELIFSIIRQAKEEFKLEDDVNHIRSVVGYDARTYSRQLANSIANNTRKALYGIQNPLQLQEAMDKVLGEARAEVIAITEVTRFQAQVLARIAATDKQGISLWWRTEEDGKVCKVCASKNRVPIAVAGLPAENSHPNCRCFVEKYGERGEVVRVEGEKVRATSFNPRVKAA